MSMSTRIPSDNGEVFLPTFCLAYLLLLLISLIILSVIRFKKTDLRGW